MAIKIVTEGDAGTWKNGLILSTLKGLWLTLSITLKQLFRIEKTRTLEWPEQEHKYSDRFKGAQFLTLRPDGRVRCTACFLCATNCPAQCIKIVASESTDKNVEKYPERFEIDMLRCVFCGYCEEACPVDAIRMGPEYALGGTADEKWVYTKERLMDRPKVKEQIGTKQVSRKAENVKAWDNSTTDKH